MVNVIKKYYINVIILLIGIVLIAFGGSTFLAAEIGSDAVMVFNQGVATFFNLEVGFGIMITNIALLLIVIFINRKSIGLGTFAMVFLLGPLVNFIIKHNILPTPSNLLWSIVMLLTGVIVGGFGISLYIYANVGLSPFEGIIITIVDKTKIRFAYIKIINDAILFTLGYLLGGVFGIGSIITVFLFGPVIDLFMKILKRSNIIKNSNGQTEEIKTL